MRKQFTSSNDNLHPLAVVTGASRDSFSFALRNELKDSGVTVTCLMPGATDTEFFARAEMLDTKVGAGKKDDPADVARVRLRGNDER
jgi:short-subunit dehydrogenase